MFSVSWIRFVGCHSKFMRSLIVSAMVGSWSCRAFAQARAYGRSMVGTDRGSVTTSQGLASDNVTAKGFGKDDPVASNNNAAGRQKNRRVEMVVSGDIIGTPIGPTSSSIR